MTQAVFGVITFALCWVIACRIDRMMRGVTRGGVFWQHFLLGMAAFTAWLLGFTRFEQWSSSVLALGVLVFFMFSVQRWRHGAPGDTVRADLQELPPEQWRHVYGGKK